MNQQQQEAPGRDSFRGFLSWMNFFCQALSLTVTVFLHRRFGSRYIGLQGLAAIVLIFFFPIFWPYHDPRPLLWFLGAFVFMCFCARTGVVYRRLRGQQSHSLYDGWPRLMRFFPRISEITMKRGIEPALVFVVGALLLRVNEPLGSYLITAAFGLFASVNISVGQQYWRAVDMNDAMIDQQFVAQQWRTMRGE